MKIQFYSITTVDDALAAIDAGADLLGLVVDAHGLVPEEIPPARARAILAAIEGRALGIALSMSADADAICRMAEEVRPHAVHLAAARIDSEELARVRARLGTDVRIMVAIPVTDERAVTAAREQAQFADYLLLDSKSQSDPFTGATGNTHDWSVSRRIVEEVAVPAVLAGGLSPENVGAAIAAVRPWGVDSMTHTNMPTDRTRKDPQRMRAFVRAARAAARRHGL